MVCNINLKKEWDTWIKPLPNPKRLWGGCPIGRVGLSAFKHFLNWYNITTAWAIATNIQVYNWSLPTLKLWLGQQVRSLQIYNWSLPTLKLWLGQQVRSLQIYNWSLPTLKLWLGQQVRSLQIYNWSLPTLKLWLGQQVRSLQI
ncbi:MAG: hypothetical protein ACHBN1_35120 [Heteroscytonema crispum UTEX LB 1556]